MEQEIITDAYPRDLAIKLKISPQLISEVKKGRRKEEDMYIYLSGPIYPQDREATEKWRSLVRKWSFYKDGVKILDPCRGKPTYESSMFTPNEILLRDLMDIDKADLVLVFFNVKDDKISIGTIAEMMYAWLKKKPVVFVNPTKDLQYLSDHPWIKALTVRQFSNLEDALTYIDGFWSE